MLVYSLVGVTQGMFFTYSVSVISTIEKRFKLTSKETGSNPSEGNRLMMMIIIMTNNNTKVTHLYTYPSLLLPSLPFPPPGILLTGNDISQTLLAIFLSYYGTFGHRPRWLGVGALLTALSCLTAALPHIIYGPGRDALEAARAASLPTTNYSSSSSLLMQNLTGQECEYRYEY